MEFLILFGAMLVAFGLAAVIKRIAARAAVGEDRSEVSPYEFVTLATFRNSTDAELLRSRLESAGIKCVLFGETVSHFDPRMTMFDDIQLKVLARDVQRAAEYLS